MIYGTPAGVSVTTYTPPPQGRYRISLNLMVQNLTNHTNLSGFSGVLTSPYFGQPTIALPPRRVNVVCNSASSCHVPRPAISTPRERVGAARQR